MLVLTQASAGALALDLAVGHRRSTAAVAVAVALVGLAISILHLGHPERAWRALAGFRHSWLSREVGALGLFGGLAVLALLTDSVALQAVAAATGLAGVACSAMLYVVTRRPSWRAAHTLPRFAFGSLVGGAALTLVAGGGRAAALVLVVGMAAKLSWEARFVWRRAPGQVPERWLGPVPAHGLARFLLGVSAAFLALNATGGPGAGLALVAVMAGELIERSRFFSAASWTGMPGPKS
jgi:DMSO reductase anchor subunit